MNLEVPTAEGAPCFVVFHVPGPRWVPKRHPLQQPGVNEHFAYLAGAFESGKILMGGPFLAEDAGGMMILNTEISENEARTLAAEDPGVASGLIRAEVRPWMVTLKADSCING